MASWGVAVAALLGAVAWIYQRAWDRQQARVARYQKILDSLPGLTQERLNPDQIDAILNEVRCLWLFAPDDVVKTANSFLNAAETGDRKPPALSQFILAMRRDASFEAALFPRFFRSKLGPDDVGRILHATRPPSQRQQGVE